ncbi:ADENYLATE ISOPENTENYLTRANSFERASE 4-RELATED [Salix koriyanagi]|uniref:adenylate dimethylallyltransferase (ADP/ATP-dependent) n=1 Tax=Salix koriyanagi TaxID=2511006 RepID=A0A9Q0WRM7_9ROSI|nr:ADENYLATE ISOPENTENYLTRANSFERASE 4-RELATED [Salix koriyanagi]
MSAECGALSLPEHSSAKYKSREPAVYLSHSLYLSVFWLPMKLSSPKSTIHSHYTAHKIQPLHPVTISKPFSKPRPPPRGVRMDTDSSTAASAGVHHLKKDKILVIMGATGSTKVSTSPPTKSPFKTASVFPTILLGEYGPDDGELTLSDFRFAGGLAISGIVSRQRLPIVVGGSNSLIHALVVDRFNPELNVFAGSNPVSTQLRYNCCFLWVDVSLPVLCDYLCMRVDEMLDSGMFDELSEYYGSIDSANQTVLRKAIGVPEFDRYFKKYPPGSGCGRGIGGEWDQAQRGIYEECVREIKENTCQLAKRQIGKILRLKGAGWDLHRVDATESFREVMMVRTSDEDGHKRKTKKRKKKKRWVEVWGRDVMEPSMKIVKRFLDE